MSIHCFGFGGGRLAPSCESRQASRQAFTLVELVVAMAIFSLMMMVLINIFTSSQRVWSTAAARTEMFENARIALDIIALDLQTAHYDNGKVPFWHKPMTDPTNGAESYISVGPGEPPYSRYANEMLAFVAATPSPQSTNTSNLNEIKYQLAYAETNEYNAGWLMRSTTGDSSGNLGWFRREDGWNDAMMTVAGWAGAAMPNQWPNNSSMWPVVGGANNEWEYVFTQGEGSSDPYRRLIPHVTNLEFVCLDKEYNLISDKSTIIYRDKSTPFPYMVMVKLSLMDAVAWEKWLAIGGLPHQPIRGGESARAQEFRAENERTFTKLVLIGDRGQYE